MIALNDLSRHVQPMREDLLAAFTRVLDRGWFVLGPELQALEDEFAAHFGLRHAVGVANGTDAIELALRALGVSEGDEVILAPNAGMYAATALRAIGATAVYVDVCDSDLNLNPTAVTAAITAHTKVVIATHLFGRMANMPVLRELADRHGLLLVEDCAQAIGACCEGIHAGAWGDAASFSFYPTKNLGALGDAGMVTCRDRAVAERVRNIRQYGWRVKYVVDTDRGRNSRLDEIQAALLRVQLPLVRDWNARRRAVAMRYASVAHPQLRHPVTCGDDFVAHLYVVRTDFRASLQAHLKANGVSCDIHYPLLDTLQPVNAGGPNQQPHPVAEAAVGQILSLPCFPELTDAEIAHVCETLATWEPL